jgi:hypothetical protein
MVNRTTTLSPSAIILVESGSSASDWKPSAGLTTRKNPIEPTDVPNPTNRDLHHAISVSRQNHYLHCVYFFFWVARLSRQWALRFSFPVAESVIAATQLQSVRAPHAVSSLSVMQAGSFAGCAGAFAGWADRLANDAVSRTAAATPMIPKAVLIMDTLLATI